MSRLYDTIEPSVINDDMLQDAVEEQGPKNVAGKIAKEEGIDFIDVIELRLDFRNILKIDNLWCFTNLVKLQLDNNIIEVIEGLDILVHLVWLDLSFNNIEVIDGLERLTKLHDLTLFSNRIKCIENMDTLTELQVFSVGNNELCDLDNVKYLRRFKNLQSLNLSGNKLCEEPEYRLFIGAYLPQLQFLDYRLLDQNLKTAAFEKYEILLLEIQHDERQAEIKQREQLANDNEILLHKAAYVEQLDGPFLFDSMYADDPEGPKLNDIPGLQDILALFKEKFTSTCKEMFQYGLEKHKEREEDVSLFKECLEEAKQENKALATEKIEEFNSYKNKLWSELVHMTDASEIETKINEYHQKVSELWDSLMGLEMQLVDQLEEAVKEFDRSLADLVGAFIENMQGLMSQCRELENQHHERLLEIAVITLEKVMKSELEEDISDDLRELLIDKDTVINAVTTSHDAHLLKIDNREDEMITRIRQWLSTTVDAIHEREEVRRNRSRVIEISHFIDHLRDEIDSLEFGGFN